jgi:hypothetical protein
MKNGSEHESACIKVTKLLSGIGGFSGIWRIW